jgi:DNA-binding MarR family transcriptional regulator
MSEPLVDALERVALAAVGLTARALADAPSGPELTLPQWRVVVIVGERTEGTRIGEIARRLGSGLPATGRLVHRLEHRGLVTSRTDPADRRATLVSLSPDGETVRSRILGVRRAQLRNAAAAIEASRRSRLAVDLETIADELEAAT